MSYFKRFNRHEIFGIEMMEFHADTVREVENFFLDSEISMYNQLTNKLYGIWDGFLYTDLLRTAKEYKLPANLINRIEKTINFIEDKIKVETI